MMATATSAAASPAAGPGPAGAVTTPAQPSPPVTIAPRLQVVKHRSPAASRPSPAEPSSAASTRRSPVRGGTTIINNIITVQNLHQQQQLLSAANKFGRSHLGVGAGGGNYGTTTAGAGAGVATTTPSIVAGVEAVKTSYHRRVSVSKENSGRHPDDIVKEIIASGGGQGLMANTTAPFGQSGPTQQKNGARPQRAPAIMGPTNGGAQPQDNGGALPGSGVSKTACESQCHQRGEGSVTAASAGSSREPSAKCSSSAASARSASCGRVGGAARIGLAARAVPAQPAAITPLKVNPSSALGRSLSSTSLLGDYNPKRHLTASVSCAPGGDGGGDHAKNLAEGGASGSGRGPATSLFAAARSPGSSSATALGGSLAGVAPSANAPSTLFATRPKMPTIALNKSSLLARGAVGSSPADDAKPASGAKVANDQAAASGGVAAKRDAGATTEPSERTTRVATAGNSRTNLAKKTAENRNLLHSVLANTDKHSPKLHPSRWIAGGGTDMMPRVNKSAPNMNYCEVPVEREVGCIRKVSDAAKAVSNSEEHVIELALDPDFVEEEEQPAPVAHRPPAGVDVAESEGVVRPLEKSAPPTKELHIQRVPSMGACSTTTNSTNGWRTAASSSSDVSTAARNNYNVDMIAHPGGGVVPAVGAAAVVVQPYGSSGRSGSPFRGHARSPAEGSRHFSPAVGRGGGIISTSSIPVAGRMSPSPAGRSGYRSGTSPYLVSSTNGAMNTTRPRRGNRNPHLVPGRNNNYQGTAGVTAAGTPHHYRPRPRGAASSLGGPSSRPQSPFHRAGRGEARAPEMVVDLLNLPDPDLSAGGQGGTGFGIGNQSHAHQMLLQGSASFKELFGGGTNPRPATSSSDYTNETDRLSRLPISPIDFMSKSSCSLHSAKTFTTTQYGGGSSFAADRSVVQHPSHSQIKRNPGKIMGVLLQPHVYCRIRPQLSREERLNLCVDVRSETAAEMLLNGSGDCHKLISILDESTHEVREFKFHNVFQQQSTQEEIFHNIGEPCFQSWAYNRISTCLFAHGQTSTGKTYSIIGDKNTKHAGLLPRILWRFFESFPALSVSVVEIYREQIYDLLNKRQPVKCYNSSTQTIKRSVTKVPCDCYKAALKAVEKGNRLRVEARTVLNSVSSRGHLIILLEYRGETLCVVDLAGKETEAGISSLREVLEETARRRSLRGIRDNASASDLGQHQQHQLSRSESNDLALAGVESRSRFGNLHHDGLSRSSPHIGAGALRGRSPRIRHFHNDSRAASPKNRGGQSQFHGSNGSASHELTGQLHRRSVSAARGTIPISRKRSRTTMMGRSSCGPTSAADSKIRMLELKFINKSLFHLSEVIQNLRKDSKVVCYRNSKLTYLLQDWLSSKQVYLLATISPSELCFEESLATLRFADAVANLPKLRETPTRGERGPTWSGAGAAGGSGWEEADLGGVGGPSVSPEDRCPITLAPRLTPASRRKEGTESSFFGLREEAGSQGAENCPFWSSSKKTIERVGQNALLLPS